MNDQKHTEQVSNRPLRQHLPGFYQIRVDGRISRRRAIWFESLDIAVDGENNDHVITTLTGRLIDQAALLGTLQKLYTLGFTILSVWRIEKANQDKGEDKNG